MNTDSTNNVALQKALEREKKKNLRLQKKMNRLQDLEKEWKKLSIAVTQSPSITVITDPDGCIEYVNPVFCHVTGYAAGEVLGENPRVLKSNRHDKVFYNTLWKTIRSGKTWHGEFENRRKNGNTYWEAAQISPLTNEAGEITHFIKVSNDVTHRKQAEERLQRDLQEKEILLKEIHHRVKNNLQIINSLLNLQASRTDDARTLQILEQSSQRVRSMALVHEKLYQSASFSAIDFKVYIESLVMELFQAYAPGNRIQIEFKSQPVTLGLDQAIPCGLIVNELVTNALKHGFPNDRRGTIQIEMRASKQINEIVIRDDGIGMPEDMISQDLDSLGLKLVRILGSQLHAETTWQFKGGTSFQMKFKTE